MQNHPVLAIFNIDDKLLVFTKICENIFICLHKLVQRLQLKTAVYFGWKPNRILVLLKSTCHGEVKDNADLSSLIIDTGSWMFNSYSWARHVMTQITDSKETQFLFSCFGLFVWLVGRSCCRRHWKDSSECLDWSLCDAGIIITKQLRT